MERREQEARREILPGAASTLDLMECMTDAKDCGDTRLLEDCRAALRARIAGTQHPPYTIAVDFDGVLCDEAWPDIGRPKTEIIGYLNALRENYGVRLVLHTCREGERLIEARQWCHAQGLQFDSVNESLAVHIEKFGGVSRKPYANEYWDDCAVTV